MSDPLQLPFDTSVRLDNKSYKTPARLIVRTVDDREGWRVWLWLHGVEVELGEITEGSQGTALYFDRNDARSAKDRGVNGAIARLSGGRLGDRDIHTAEEIYLFAVSPDGKIRSRVQVVQNDKYIPKSGNSGPPWKLDGRGNPDKARRSRFLNMVDFPPGYAPDDDDDEPPPVDDGWFEEPDIAPIFDHLVLADEFRAWRSLPPTLAVEIDSAVINADESIQASWLPYLGQLPRFEGGRFGRLCWVAWDGRSGLWVGGHGEHLRIQGGADEGSGAAIHRWAEDNLTLGETLARKSKLDGVEKIEIGRLKRIGLFIVKHEENPIPGRSRVFWFGEPFEDSGNDDDGDDNGDDDDQPPDCSAQVRAARAADAAKLDAVEDRLRAEVITPFSALSPWGKLTNAADYLLKAEEIIEEDYRPVVNDMRGGPRDA